MAVLLFESRDGQDIIYPATIEMADNSDFKQELDAFAAHNWDGFYVN